MSNVTSTEVEPLHVRARRALEKLDSMNLSPYEQRFLSNAIQNELKWGSDAQIALMKRIEAKVGSSLH
jgi:hypothetical protein